jgi:hypothetical protein
MTEKRQTCIHLSNQILSNHFSLGNAAPGRHKRTVTKIDHVSAMPIACGVFFKKKEFLCNDENSKLVAETYSTNN